MTSPLFSWLTQRSSGLLLHPTSFPGQQGIGVLDQAVDHLFDFLQAAEINHWQFCPLGPTGYGDSPYQCFSAFAGNPYLIDLQALVTAQLLTAEEVATLQALPTDRIDYGWLYATKWPLLHLAHERFRAAGYAGVLAYGSFAAFRREHSSWLEAYALFLALKDHYKGQPWWEWPAEVRFYDPARQSSLARLPAVTVRAEAHAFFQYLFFGQWQEVRAKARARQITLIGDAPIFVARDSADVWMHPHLFQVDAQSGQPLVVAGVPPDYFSADGQLWGNPLYRWEAHASEGFAWWIARLRANFALCDIVRIDHFRAFDSYWSIPAEAKTARTGTWEKGPGLPLFHALKAALPEARMIAEDLGDLTPSVLTLRDATGLPGMTILQFAFGSGADNGYLPHNVRANSIVYPGTHDNDTTLGWYRTATAKERDHVRKYLRVNGQEIGWDFLRIAYQSVNLLAVFPLQDLLSLGSAARMNTPGLAAGNWQWRYSHAQLAHLHKESAAYLAELGLLFGRARPPEPELAITAKASTATATLE